MSRNLLLGGLLALALGAAVWRHASGQQEQAAAQERDALWRGVQCLLGGTSE